MSTEVIMKELKAIFLLMLIILLFCSCAHQKKQNFKAQVVSNNDVPTYIAPNNLAEVNHLIENDCDHYMGTLIVKESMKVPAHTHLKSDEYLYMIKGKGKLMIANKIYQVKKGDGIFIPKGVLHSYKNESKISEFVQVYTPKGPEQRFKKWKLKK